MIFRDSGFIISLNTLNDNKKIVTIFTKNNGKISGVILKKTSVLLFDNVLIDFYFKKNNSLCYITIIEKTSKSIFIFNKQYHITTLQAISFAIYNYICNNIKNEKLYHNLFDFINNINNYDNQTIFLTYTYIDLQLLYACGYGFNLECHCGKQAYVINYAGDSYCENCFLSNNEFFYIPNTWFQWINNDFSYFDKKDLHESLKITDYFFLKYFNNKINKFKEIIKIYINNLKF